MFNTYILLLTDRPYIMGWGFRKKIGIGKLLRLNVSKSGVSLNVGIKGASINIGAKGVYANVGIPGTGLYSRTKLSGTSRKTNEMSYEEFHEQLEMQSKIKEASEKEARMAARSSVPIIIDDLSKFDPLFPQVVEYVVKNEDSSYHGIKTKFNIDYDRVGALREQMITAGIIRKDNPGHPTLLVNEDAIQDLMKR